MTQIHDQINDVPDRWLRTFSEAARSGSFTAAGVRLGVSQPAVSHTIRRLERTLGVALFERDGPKVLLTLAGSRLLGQVGPAMDQLDRAVLSTQQLWAADNSVAVSVSTSLASYWLMPRLHLFKSEHPGIELRVITNDTDRGVGKDDADLWIPLGLGPWPQLRSWDLFAERIYPIASPDYAAGLDSAANIEDAIFIHLEERYTARFDWQSWWSRMGIPAGTRRGATSNDYSLVIQSAIDGQGIALGWHHIVGPLVQAGILVRLGPDEILTDSLFPVLAKRARPKEPAQKMLEWLLTQAA